VDDVEVVVVVVAGETAVAGLPGKVL